MIFGNLQFIYLSFGLIGLFLFHLFRQRRKKKALESFAEKDLLPHLVSFSALKRQRRKILWVFLSLLFGILALMRPQMGFHWEEGRGKGINILIAIDTSKSMLVEDLSPNRLEAAKEAAKGLVRKVRGDRVGLIAFSGEAFLCCPLTVDYNILIQSLGELRTGILPTEGTSLSSAIREALKSYRSSSGEKVLLLLSDGEDLEGNIVPVAESARKEGVRIVSAGIGTREGGLIPAHGRENQKGFLKDESGNVVRSRLNEEILRKIASITGGSYVRFEEAESGVKRIYDHLSGLEKGEFEGPARKRKTEWFQFPLGLSLFFLLFELGRDRRQKRFLLGLTLLPLAFLFSCRGDTLQETHRFLVAGKYEEARKALETVLAKTPDSEIGNYNLGVLLYQNGEYSRAADHFLRVLLTDDSNLEEKANYNLGNSKYRMAEQIEKKDLQGAVELYRDALGCYQRAIELDGKDEDAQVNRQRVAIKLSQLDDLLKKRQEAKPREKRVPSERDQEPPPTTGTPYPPETPQKGADFQAPGGPKGMKGAKEAFSQRTAKPLQGDGVEMTLKEAEALLERQRSVERFFIPSKSKSKGGPSPEVKKDW